MYFRILKIAEQKKTFAYKKSDSLVLISLSFVVYIF